MASRYEKKLIGFEGLQLEEIRAYAERRNVSFSEAVRDLCSRSLHGDFDRAYAPVIGRMVADEADAAVRRLTARIDSLEEEVVDAIEARGTWR